MVGFHTTPVGAAGVGLGGIDGLTLTQAVAGTLPGAGGSGMPTCSATLVPSPSYNVEQPVALSAIQNGLAPGLNATPHAFCRTGS